GGVCFFFFQAEDGIRDGHVTGVQTCALPISRVHPELTIEETGDVSADQARQGTVDRDLHRAELLSIPVTLIVLLFAFGALAAARSEERRVGKECRRRWVRSQWRRKQTVDRVG